MNPSILIVENRLIERGRINFFLEKENYDIRYASGTEAALRMLIHIRPSLVIIGLIMTGLDSLTFTRILKNDDDTISLPIVALLDWDEEIDYTEISNYGFDGFLRIGTDKNLFTTKIRKFLKK